MVLLGLNPGYFLFTWPHQTRTSSPFDKRILKGGRVAYNNDVIQKKQLCSIVPASYETTMCCCSEKILHLGCFQTLHPQSQEFMGVYIPSSPKMSQQKGDVPNSFILVAWLRQIVYDKNASKVPVLNMWMMAALKNSAQVCTESKRFLYLSVLFLWPRVRREGKNQWLTQWMW